MKENELESLILDYFNYDTNYSCFSMSSGRSSLELVLRVLKDIPKYKERNEVIIPSYACLGVIEPVLKAGLKPVFVDIDQFLVPNPEDILRKFSARTLACYIHNLFGNDAFNHDVYEAALKNDIILLDDHCQSLYLPKKKLDNVISIFSFCYGKTLPATCGGAIVTKEFKKEIGEFFLRLPEEPIENSCFRFEYFDYVSKSIKESIRKRITGSVKSRVFPTTPYELRKMNRMDASMILMQWEKKIERFEKQKFNYAIFSKILSEINGITIANSEHSSKEFLPLLFDNEHLKNDFSNAFYKKNIELLELYIPLHLRFKEYNSVENLETTISLYKRAIGFPIRGSLTNNEVTLIQKSLREVVVENEVHK